jgi:hypothetical protein
VLIVLRRVCARKVCRDFPPTERLWNRPSNRRAALGIEQCEHPRDIARNEPIPDALRGLHVLPATSPPLPLAAPFHAKQKCEPHCRRYLPCANAGTRQQWQLDTAAAAAVDRLKTPSFDYPAARQLRASRPPIPPDSNGLSRVVGDGQSRTGSGISLYERNCG